MMGARKLARHHRRRVTRLREDCPPSARLNSALTRHLLVSFSWPLLYYAFVISTQIWRGPAPAKLFPSTSMIRNYDAWQRARWDGCSSTRRMALGIALGKMPSRCSRLCPSCTSLPGKRL